MPTYKRLLRNSCKKLQKPEWRQSLCACQRSGQRTRLILPWACGYERQCKAFRAFLAKISYTGGQGAGDPFSILIPRSNLLYKNQYE